MTITFQPLNESHFLLLLKWLESPHVKKWWDSDVTYTMELVREKYGPRISSLQDTSPSLRGAQRRSNPELIIDWIASPSARNDGIQCFIIHIDETPVGYIQIYNLHDFPDNWPLASFPQSAGAVDIFIGEEGYLDRGNGSAALQQFLETYAFARYRYVFADPEFRNETAVKAYEKAGFLLWKRVDKKFWMVAHKKIVRLSIRDMIALEVSFKQSFLPEDRLWLFGSRADLTRKGGDIDLYVETYAQTADDAINMRGNFIYNLEKEIGEQKIDVVLNRINRPYPLPIHQVALEEGIRII